MKRSIRILLLVGFSVFLVAGYFSLVRVKAETLSQPEAQQSNEPIRTVQVTGIAERDVEPDIAVVRVGVQTEAETAQAALNDNSTSVDALLSRLRELDIPARNIQTQTVQLMPRYDFDNTGNERTLVGYTAFNVVEVRIEDLDSLGNLLDQAVESGANIIEGIRFETSSSDESIDQLREAAVENARQKAEELARLTNTTLGPILEIQESSSIPAPIPAEAAAPREAAVPVLPGTQTISVQLQMTWTLNVNPEQ